MSVVPDLARNRIAVGSWSRRVEVLDLSQEHAEALLQLHRDLALRLDWLPGSGDVTVSLWAPDRVQGVAVVLEDLQSVPTSDGSPDAEAERAARHAAFEAAVSLAASIAVQLLRRGFHVGLVAGGG